MASVQASEAPSRPIDTMESFPTSKILHAPNTAWESTPASETLSLPVSAIEHEPASKTPKQSLNNKQRAAICEHKDRNPKITQTELARWAQEEFNLEKPPPQSTISEILKRRSVWLHKSFSEPFNKRARLVHHPELDAALASWVSLCQARNVIITNELIVDKAKSLAQNMNIPNPPQFSHGWLDKFLKRHHFRSLRKKGKPDSICERTLNGFWDSFAKYSPADIYNMDETTLLYCMAPDRTIVREQAIKRACLTVALCVNADGTDKRGPLFIGRTRQPRCFKSKTPAELGCDYRSNKQAKMTVPLFQDWLLTFEDEMKKADRKVLLLVDQAPSHVTDGLDLNHVRVEMLSLNAVSWNQPMKSGIIAAFKRQYRLFHYQNALDREERGEINIYQTDLLSALRWCKRAWMEVTPVTIQKCWERVSLVTSTGSEPLHNSHSHQEQAVDKELQELIQKLRPSSPIPVASLLTSVDEANMSHQELVDEVIKTMTGHELKSEMDGDSDEDSSDGTLHPIPKDVMDALSIVIASLDISDDRDFDLYKTLREKKEKLRQNYMTQMALGNSF